jgi:hypothetical protein
VDIKRFSVFVMAAALAAYLLMGLSFIKSAAPTYDETVHLASGYSYLATGRYVMNIMDHPPLAEMVDALPLLFYRPNVFSGHPFFTGARQYQYGDLFLYFNSVDAEKLLNTARVFSFLLWSGLIVLFVRLFAARLAGGAAGAFAVAVFALMPAFISNNALITTDAAPAAFYFAAFCLGWIFMTPPARPETARGGKDRAAREEKHRYAFAALTGLASGLAMASKFSMFIVPPLILAFWAAHNFFERKLSPRVLLRYSAVYLAAAGLTVAVVYKFDIALYLTGLETTLRRLDQGRSSFAMGKYSINGVWWYFPLALAVKTPLAVLALALAGLLRVKADLKKEHAWLLLPPLIYFAVALTAKVQIGYRHILPVMPFLAVLAGLGADYVRRKRILIYLFSPLLLLWGWGLAGTGPYYLAYFNELAGGPAGGYKVLVDSNLDWGQDLKALGGWLARRGNPPVLLSYFGVARPEYYGIKYQPLGPLFSTGADICRMDRLLLAVSATNLQSTYYPDKKTFDWLKTRKPVFTAGYSIFVYDLGSDAEGLEKLAGLFDRYGQNSEADCLRARSSRAPRP